MPSFRITALPARLAAELSAMSPEQRAARGVQQVTATSSFGYPCRISLEDAHEGETLYLLHHTHFDVASPFRAAGPIFIRRDAVEAQPDAERVGAFLARRTLSLRAYDAADMMIGAELCEGSEVDAILQRFFADAMVSRVHLHSAKPGCYLCAAERIVEAATCATAN